MLSLDRFLLSMCRTRHHRTCIALHTCSLCKSDLSQVLREGDFCVPMCEAKWSIYNFNYRCSRAPRPKNCLRSAWLTVDWAVTSCLSHFMSSKTSSFSADHIIASLGNKSCVLLTVDKLLIIRPGPLSILPIRDCKNNTGI